MATEGHPYKAGRKTLIGVALRGHTSSLNHSGQVIPLSVANP